MIEFDLPKEQASIIKVIGVGGGGGNAVNYMFKQGIKDVNFVVCNTDSQDLDRSPIANPNKIQIGPSLTKGRGAGSFPEVGRNAIMESLEDIKQILQSNTQMVFITAGMGGGTGTGGAPIVAKMAKDLGLLTVAIVTTPFNFEGKRRKQQAEEGIAELKKVVDSIIIISNDKLREMYGNLTITEAFSKADNVLTTAAKGIAEIITVTGYINVDFEDVKTVMSNSGVAIMGSSITEGEGRALKAVEEALASPLLYDNDIRGARHILLNITSGTKEVTMDEISEITDFVQNAAGKTDIIWGNCFDETLGEKLSLTVIATGFETNHERKIVQAPKKEKIVRTLVDEKNEEIQNYSSQIKKQENKTENQSALQFDLTPVFQVKQEDKTEITIVSKIIDNTSVGRTSQNKTEEESEQIQKAKERISKLKSLSISMKNPNAISEMEKLPAYLRRDVQLENTPHSSESNISRYTLSEPNEEEKKPELKKNNSFLHDKVD